MLCLEQSAGLAYGNQTCESFYTAINAQPRKTKLIKNVVPDDTTVSLDANLAMHPQLQWLASTLVGLYRFRTKEDLVHATILAFVVQANQEPGTLPSERNPKYDPRITTMKRILDKVLGCIWFHVVGSTLDINKVLPLPPDLDKVCDAHYLTPFELGSCLAQVRAASQGGGEIVIESKYFIKDMVWWLWYHFPGNLTAVVGGEILLDKPGEHPDGSAPSRIEIRIQTRCPENVCGQRTGPGSRFSKNTVRLSLLVADKAHNLFERIAHNAGKLFLGDRGAADRIDLYDIFTTRRDRETVLDSEGLQIETIRSTAAIIVFWLLNLPVSGPVEDNPDLAYTVCFNPPKEMPRVMDLVDRSPFILNLGWEGRRGDAVDSNVFKAPSPSKGKGVAGEPFQQARRSITTDFEMVLEHYPILTGLANRAESACKCMHCRQVKAGTGSSGSTRAIFDKGCLQNKALIKTLQLVAHAIANCFGCEDASAPSSNAEDLGVLALLLGVAHGVVRWNDWFAVASRVFLGCPDLLETQGPRGVDKSPRLAVQYGELVTLAPWLDLSADLRLVKPFSMQRVKGRIKNVEGDFALIEARISEAIKPQFDNVHNIQDAAAPGYTALVDPHKSLETDIILFPTARNHYELSFRVQTKGYSRLIDPSNAIRVLPKLWEANHSCFHSVDETSGPGDPIAGAVQASSFDQVLGTWGTGFSVSAGMSLVKHILYGRSPLCDSHLRLNITASLTQNHARILIREKACVACRSNEKDKLAEMVDGERRAVWNKKVAFVVCASDHILQGTRLPLIL